MTDLHATAHVDTFCRDHLPPQELWPEFLAEVPEVDYPERLNCAVELLDRTVEKHGRDRPCLHTPDGVTWSYGDLLDRSSQLARLLVDEHGLVPGNRVLLRGPNNPWLVASWFAVIKAGCVVVPTMPMLRPTELSTIGEIARVDLAICDVRFVGDLSSGLPNVRTLTYGGGDVADLARVCSDLSTSFDGVDTASDDVCMLAFTSGTTGRPKATMHFHRDVLANADTFSAYVLRPTADDVFIGTPPIAFTFGLGGLVVFPTRVGASTVLVEKATPAELAEIVQTKRATICFTAPTAYRAILANGLAPQLGTLRRAVSAGEHLPVSTWHAFKDATGLSLIDGIGSTEMLHIFISAADEDIRPGSTGRPVPGYRATILGPDGKELPDGESGRLAVKGPTGCRYLDDPRQRNYVHDGWNVTGDTFVRDSDGYFWYQARSDDMIISSGYNISGPEVEEAVATHPAVLECAVIGVPDEARGHVVKAFVVLRPDAQVEPAEEAQLVRSIQDHVKQQIAPYKYPRQVEVIDALPRTSTGKIQRFRLREQEAMDKERTSAVN